MDDAGFSVELSITARRNFYNQVLWLQENLSQKKAEDFAYRFTRLLRSLSEQPLRWQKVVVTGRSVRRAVLLRHWVVLYEVEPDPGRVFVLTIRGAREDWTNSPISD